MKSTTSLLMMEWLDEESRGFTDEFPVSWFVNEGELKNQIHSVRGARNECSRATCNVHDRGRLAEVNHR